MVELEAVEPLDLCPDSRTSVVSSPVTLISSSNFFTSADVPGVIALTFRARTERADKLGVGSLFDTVRARTPRPSNFNVLLVTGKPSLVFPLALLTSAPFSAFPTSGLFIPFVFVDTGGRIEVTELGRLGRGIGCVGRIRVAAPVRAVALVVLKRSGLLAGASVTAAAAAATTDFFLAVVVGARELGRGDGGMAIVLLTAPLTRRPCVAPTVMLDMSERIDIVDGVFRIEAALAVVSLRPLGVPDEADGRLGTDAAGRVDDDDPEVSVRARGGLDAFESMRFEAVEETEGRRDRAATEAVRLPAALEELFDTTL